MLSLLGNMAVVMSMVQDPKVKKLFEDTNTRIYQAFQGIDALLRKKAGCGQPITSALGGAPMSATWAPAYSSWINAKVASQNALIVSTASALTNSILHYQANHNVATLPLPTAFGSFTRAYDVNSMTFNYDLVGLIGAPLLIQRTEEACTPTASPATATSSLTIPTSTLPPSIVSVDLLPATVSYPLMPAPTAPPPIVISEPTVAILAFNYADCTTIPCIDTARVYEILGGASADPCAGPGNYTQTSKFGPGAQMPFQIGPFSAHGAVGCILDGISTAAALRCQGLAPIKCTVPPVPKTVQCGTYSSTSFQSFAWELGSCEW